MTILLFLTACAGESTSPSVPSSRRAAADDIVNEAPTGTTEPDSGVAADGDPIGSTAPPARFSKKRAMRHIRHLVQEVGTRVRATRGELMGARYMADKFRAYGYEVTMQTFSVDGDTSRNVVASWPGSKRYPVVVGGHMDSVPGSPGANDNASGIAVVLELARIFAGTDQARFTRFVAFGSEEYGEDDSHHVGSQVFVKRLGPEGRERLAGMVSVDMIADGRPLLVGNSRIAADKVADALYRQVVKRGIGVRRITLCDCSDHGPFERAGISAAFAYSGTTDYYHSPEDTMGKIEPRDVLRAGRAVKAFIRAFDAGYMDYLRSR